MQKPKCQQANDKGVAGNRNEETLREPTRGKGKSPGGFVRQNGSEAEEVLRNQKMSERRQLQYDPKETTHWRSREKGYQMQERGQEVRPKRHNGTHERTEMKEKR